MDPEGRVYKILGANGRVYKKIFLVWIYKLFGVNGMIDIILVVGSATKYWVWVGWFFWVNKI